MDSLHFDWKVVHTCQYPVPDKNASSGESACGEPAAYYGWWSDDGSDGWYLCPRHFEQVRLAEAEGA